jgi:Bacterial PH domain
MKAQRFPCTAGGAILRGRLRLRRLLVGLTLLMTAVGIATIATGATGRVFPGIFALLVALVPWTAWRMSGDLDPLWLDVHKGGLIVQMRRRNERFPIAGADARRLTPEEIESLERLTTSGGLVAGTGGFESRLLGEFDLYASDLANAVLLESGDLRMVVTPDDPEGFLAALTGE